MDQLVFVKFVEVGSTRTVHTGTRKKEFKIPLIASPAIPAALQEKQSDHQDARRHLLHFLLVDAEGRQHLAATATDAGDAHYTYR